MSWLYLQEEAEASLGESSSDGGRSAPSSGNLTLKASFWPDKLTATWNASRYGMTSEPSTEPHGVGSSTSLPRVFLANLSAKPDSEKGKTILEICGPIPSEWSARLDPVSHCWRTSQVFLLLDISEPSFEDWPRAGLIVDGAFYRRPNWELPISETVFGSLPTPKASEHKGGYSSQGGGLSLGMMATHNLWPTPTAPGSHQVGKLSEWGGSHNPFRQWPTPQSRDFRTGEAKRWDDPDRSRNLNDAVAKAELFQTPTSTNTKANHMRSGGRPPRTYLPTPQSRDHKGTGPADMKRNSPNLNAMVSKWPTPKTNGMAGGTGAMEIMERQVEAGEITEQQKRQMTAGNGGQLNPDWVEWLMGWPIGWTALKRSETVKSHAWRLELFNF